MAGLLGLSLGGGTLYAAIRAARYAKEAADHTAASVLETRRIGEAQTRAYLAIPACKLMFGDGAPSVMATLANSGQSPALNVRWHAEINFMRRDTKKINCAMTSEDYRSFLHDIRAGGDREPLYIGCDDFALGPDEISAFSNGVPVVVNVAVWASGVDVFDEAIHAEENFIHTLRTAPADRMPIEMSLASLIDKQKSEQS